MLAFYPNFSFKCWYECCPSECTRIKIFTPVLFNPPFQDCIFSTQPILNRFKKKHSYLALNPFKNLKLHPPWSPHRNSTLNFKNATTWKFLQTLSLQFWKYKDYKIAVRLKSGHCISTGGISQKQFSIVKLKRNLWKLKYRTYYYKPVH